MFVSIFLRFLILFDLNNLLLFSICWMDQSGSKVKTFCLKMVTLLGLFPVLFWRSGLPLCSCHIHFLLLPCVITMCVPPVSPRLPLVCSGRAPRPSCPRVSALIPVSAAASVFSNRLLSFELVLPSAQPGIVTFLPFVFWVDLPHLPPPPALAVSEPHKKWISLFLLLLTTKCCRQFVCRNSWK